MAIVMKNFIFFILIIACLGLIYIGLTRKGVPTVSELVNYSQPAATIPVTTTPTKSISQQAVAIISATSNPATAVNKTEVEHYRPDTSSQQSSQSPASANNSARNFTITIELLAKMHLVDKYRPGICFGAPVAVPQVAIDSLLSAQNDLADFLRQHYGLISDLEVYNKIKQLQNIQLTAITSSKFGFTFMDGQCANLVYYEGIVEVMNNVVTDTVTSQTVHSYK